MLIFTLRHKLTHILCHKSGQVLLHIRAGGKAPVTSDCGWLVKREPQISLRTFVRAYKHIRTELTKNCFYTFPLSTFMFI